MLIKSAENIENDRKKKGGRGTDGKEEDPGWIY